MIRTMLALEQARNDFVDGKMKIRQPSPELPVAEKTNKSADVIVISSPELGDDENSNGASSNSNSTGCSPRSKQSQPDERRKKDVNLYDSDAGKVKVVPEKDKVKNQIISI